MISFHIFIMHTFHHIPIFIFIYLTFISIFTPINRWFLVVLWTLHLNLRGSYPCSPDHHQSWCQHRCGVKSGHLSKERGNDLVERSTLPKTKIAIENPRFEDQVPHGYFRASTCTGKSQNIPSSHPCIVYLHSVESMEDTGNYANRSYMDGMDYRYIKTLQEGTGSMPHKAYISTSSHFFSEAMNPPAALPAKRPFLELLTAARLRSSFGSAVSVLGREKHLIFSSVMMGHEGSTAQFTWKIYQTFF